MTRSFSSKFIKFLSYNNFVNKSFNKFFFKMSCSSSSSSAPPAQEINFVQRINPIRNSYEWVEQDVNYDFHQEISRSAYADMVADDDRNKKYYEALKIAVDLKHKDGHEAIVLDIGTGTGLLSMMAAKCGADKIFACESFNPMLQCAKKVVKRNDFENKINLITKRSTDLKVGPDGDLPFRANILVTEVFDTELIGEGAITTFNHAHKHLLTEDCIVIPQSATVFALIVNSPLISDWNKINQIDFPNSSSIKFPGKIEKCNGIPSVHDIQLSEIKETKFESLSEIMPIFEFDFNSKNEIPYFRNSSSLFKSKRNNIKEANGIFMWWDLIMDPLGENIISCKPTWVGGENIAWREHWIQSNYYLNSQPILKPDQNYYLNSFHDEYSFWFKIEENPPISSNEKKERPICECGFHIYIPRRRIGMLNDTKRNQKYCQALKKSIIPGQSVCLVLSEGSLLSLLAAKLGALKVFVVEPNFSSAKLLNEVIQFNGLSEKISIIEKNPESINKEDFSSKKIDIVIGEPYYQASFYPWHNLSIWYGIQQLKWSFSDIVKIMPSKATLKGIAIDFENLWKIRAPVGKVLDEFDLEDFDSLIFNSITKSDCNVDAQPLWEYPGTASGQSFDIFTFDLCKTLPFNDKMTSSGKIPIEKNLNYNGIAFWMDWILDEDLIISSGPLNEIKLGQSLDWDLHSQQGVYFPWNNQSTNNTKDINFKCIFDANVGEINFSFF